MNEEKNQRVLAIVLAIIVIVLGVYKLFFNNNHHSKIDTDTISKVTDNSKFYTVAGCVNKYFMYSNSNDVEKILILLSTDYKKKNNIDSNNLYSYIDRLNGYYTFAPKEMYVQQLTSNTYKYYVYGLSQQENEDTVGTTQDYYIVVILDESSTTFAVEPYDGEIFKK